MIVTLDLFLTISIFEEECCIVQNPQSVVMRRHLSGADDL
jgi:hypothetical protein